MDYTSTRQTAARWGVSLREVQRLLAEGRIDGAMKYGGGWLVPATASKPIDPRTARRLASTSQTGWTFYTATALPKGAPQSALAGLDKALLPLAAADMEYRRGNTEPAKALWRDAGSPNEKASGATLVAVAAISSGDYKLYGEVAALLRQQIKSAKDDRLRALLALPETLAAVSMAAPGMTPDWLKRCDFSLFPYSTRLFLLYLYALHLRNIHEYAALLACARTALTLLENETTFTWLDIYLGLLCAVASMALGDIGQAQRHINAALELALPYGFLSPFADYLGELGATLEAAIEHRSPNARKAVIELWRGSFKNWVGFHNLLVKENITTLLTAQEYHAARLIVSGLTYAQLAQRMSLSVSRVKDIISSIYSKLGISRRSEIAGYIM